jgi:15-cis-phytoene synthase
MLYDRAMQDAFAHCEALVRAGDKDRYLASLFAPAAQRDALYALYAFNIEIARVREIVREPLAGEIRLQWWTDAITGEAVDARANPVAAALLATIERYRLPAEPLTGLIAARRFDLYNDPMATLALLEDYARSTSSCLIELAARALGGSQAPVEELAREAGLGYALAGLLKAFPIHSARGQLFLPMDVLDRHGARREEIAARHPTPQLRAAVADMREKARAHLGKARSAIGAAPPAALPAFLPVAVAGLLLDRMEDERRDPFAPIEIPQWRRQWRLWRAARKPALIFA